jgi:hypothetical protein
MSGKKGTSKHGKIEKSPDVNSSTPLSTESQSSPRTVDQDSFGHESPGTHSVSQNHLDADDVNILKTIIREYKAHRMDFTVLPPRPRFKPPRINTGIICNAEIRKRASAKAKADPNVTGGSLSSLTELLLWKYLGCPSDVVKTGTRE